MTTLQEVAGDVKGCHLVLTEIRDLMRYQVGQGPAPKPAPAAQSDKPIQAGKLTTAQVIERIPKMTRKNLLGWLDRRPELRAFTEERGQGRSLLWDPKVIYWFKDHRDQETGRYKD